MSETIVVPTSVEHPLGSGAGAVTLNASAPTPKGDRPAWRQVIGLALFLVGIVLGAVAAFRLSTTWGVGYLAVVLTVAGVALSYDTPDEED